MAMATANHTGRKPSSVTGAKQTFLKRMVGTTVTTVMLVARFVRVAKFQIQ
jgi:hypothetical protein